MHGSQSEDPALRDNGSNATAKAGRRWVLLGACLLCMAVSVVSSALVLPFQSIWLDESAQMSGLEGDPIAIARWLAGGAKYNHWLPDDRMPPLGYWAGWLWSRGFGLAEGPMRWFGA